MNNEALLLLSIINSIQKPLYSEIESYMNLMEISCSGIEASIIYEMIASRNYLLQKYSKEGSMNPYRTDKNNKNSVKMGLNSIRSLA